MSASATASGQPEYDLDIVADVLVIGGSLAGSWAAIAAARQGAQVVVADKGYAGSSGPIAAGSVGAYFTKPDDPIQRDVAVNARMPLAFGLADSRWGERILDQTYRSLAAAAEWGYEWPRIADGREKRGHITPNFLAFLRRQLERHGVRILDNSPALELLKSDGVVAGAAGVVRRTGETWRVRTGAVVVATGGTAFLSKLAGAGGLTGDGYLLAAEAGAAFSGMEFSGQYAVRPKDGTLTKGMYRHHAGQARDVRGNKVEPGRQIAKALIEDGQAWDKFEKVTDPELQKLVYGSQWVSNQYFEDVGINPFEEAYEVDYVLEGTIRGIGGIDIDQDLSAAPGLFAAGDVTSREKMNGAGPPGGGPDSGWAIGAGYLAGESAARYAKRFGNSIGTRKLENLGGIGLRPTGRSRDDIVLKEIVTSVQDEMLPLDRNFWRSGPNLEASLAKFDQTWQELRESLAAQPTEDRRESARARLRARETAALLSAARWINASALERKETRGLHRRSDYPTLDPEQRHHLISGGLDKVWVKVRPADPTAVYPKPANAA